MRYGFKKTQFAHDIRMARISRQLTQKQVGEEFGVGGSTISNWERPKGTVPAHRLLALCYLFDLNPSKYFSIYEEPLIQREKMLSFDDSHSWRPDIQQETLDHLTEQAIAAENMNYAEWREAGYGVQGMPVAEEWQ